MVFTHMQTFSPPQSLFIHMSLWGMKPKSHRPYTRSCFRVFLSFFPFFPQLLQIIFTASVRPPICPPSFPPSSASICTCWKPLPHLFPHCCSFHSIYPSIIYLAIPPHLLSLPLSLQKRLVHPPGEGCLVHFKGVIIMALIKRGGHCRFMCVSLHMPASCVFGEK